MIEVTITNAAADEYNVIQIPGSDLSYVYTNYEVGVAGELNVFDKFIHGPTKTLRITFAPGTWSQVENKPESD